MSLNLNFSLQLKMFVYFYFEKKCFSFTKNNTSYLRSTSIIIKRGFSLKLV